MTHWPDDEPWVEISTHVAEDRWPKRAPDATVGPRAAWLEAEPLDGHFDLVADEARYHAPTETVLVRLDDVITTCLDVDEAAPNLQGSVRRLGDVAEITRGGRP